MQVLFIVISYFVGAIPFGLIVSKMVGTDVRLQGSRNIGATNVSRVLGKKLGVLTLVCDCLKGFLPIYGAATFLPANELKDVVVALCGVMAVVGHMFPVYLRFKGGKGVATGLGVFLFLSPFATLISLVVFVVTVALTGFVSAGSLIASALIAVWIYLLDGLSLDVITAVTIAVLIWYKHHENIARLVAGQEKSWKKGRDN